MLPRDEQSVPLAVSATVGWVLASVALFPKQGCRDFRPKALARAQWAHAGWRDASLRVLDTAAGICRLWVLFALRRLSPQQDALRAWHRAGQKGKGSQLSPGDFATSQDVLVS